MKNNWYVRDGNYIYFGSYPQTVKKPNVTITGGADKDGYYTGSDGYKYAKVKATTDRSKWIYDLGKFIDGTTIEKDKDYYFKIEPVK